MVFWLPLQFPLPMSLHGIILFFSSAFSLNFAFSYWLCFSLVLLKSCFPRILLRCCVLASYIVRPFFVVTGVSTFEKSHVAQHVVWTFVGHQWQSVFFVKPILCHYCEYFVFFCIMFDLLKFWNKQAYLHVILMVKLVRYCIKQN